ncbi:uncharacterized protein EMH_0000020 [Eimeria mitis]|uniref:Uncharacterized protein n=1 Tax=Eimeria mitis TaxID=44415 RepID=U6JMX4_9EIME|nr:uncharacterized protein EMH_0000020 [Eimeria mitis]CDJ26849.1 hypothetical protein, conserved [Eimeria mitis]
MDFVEKRLPAWEECPDNENSPQKPVEFFNLSSGLTTGMRSSELPSKVELHALVPAEVRLGTTQLMIAFLLEEKYSTWRWLYNRACENIEIRNREMPLSLETCCEPTPGLNVSVPQYSGGMAACCVEHHARHVSWSLELTQNTCEIELEASYAFREWLVQQVGTSLVQPDCLVRECKVADSYTQMIKERLSKVTKVRSVYRAAQSEFPSLHFEGLWEERVKQQVQRMLQDVDAKELLTPFPVKQEMTPEEAASEARRKSLLSRSDLELEKVHPERIDFLGFVFESYRYGTEHQARKLEKEYSDAHPPTQDDGDAPQGQKSTGRRPEAESERSNYDKEILLSLCDCF